MIKNWFKKKFTNSDWRFVGKLPKQYDRNLFFVTPYVNTSDYLNFYLAISSITEIKHQFFIKKKWYLKSFTLFFNKHQTFFKPNPKTIDKIFTTKKTKQRQINIIVGLSNKQILLEGVDLDFYKYAIKHRLPITLITIDRVEKMIKFHTVFYASKNFDRDMTFIDRYFRSHERKNKKFAQL